MLLVPNYWVRMFSFALMGLLQLKNSVCYTWLFGLIHSKNKQSVCSFLNAYDTLTTSVTCIYFVYVSKEWFYLYFFMTVLGTFSFLVTILVVPEAPRWLLVNGKLEDAIRSFNFIATFNLSNKLISK